jgi:mannose-6-phosphate isomerase-like protein (cupin superfamily)
MARLTEHDPARHPAHEWFVERIEALACAERTPDRQIAMVERSARRDSMPPLHRRDEDEVYRVLDGEVQFFVGADAVVAERGDVVVAPRGVARSFRVRSETARWLVLTRVSSLDRFVDFGRAVAGAAPSARPEPAVVAIAAANGIELLGPPGALPAT